MFIDEHVEEFRTRPQYIKLRDSTTTPILKRLSRVPILPLDEELEVSHVKPRASVRITKCFTIPPQSGNCVAPLIVLENGLISWQVQEKCIESAQWRSRMGSLTFAPTSQCELRLLTSQSHLIG